MPAMASGAGQRAGASLGRPDSRALLNRTPHISRRSGAAGKAAITADTSAAVINPVMPM